MHISNHFSPSLYHCKRCLYLLQLALVHQSSLSRSLISSSENSSFQSFFFFREPPSLSRNCTYTPVWGNCQNKHTLSPCSPGLEVYLNSQGETKGSWFRRYLFLRLVNGFFYYTRPAVCKLVLLRGKELRFWNESNSWWGLELHNLALCQSRWEHILFWYGWV